MGNRLADVIWLSCVCAEAALVVASRRQALRDPSHRPIPYLATWVIVADVTMRLLRDLLIAPGPFPLRGWGRAAHHLESALFTSWPCALAFVAVWCFLPGLRKSALWVPVGAWLGMNVGVALSFPIGWMAMQRIFFLTELVAVASVILAAVAGWDQRWGSVHRAVLFLAGTELVVALVGPYATNIYKDWSVATAIYTVAFGGLAAWYFLLSLFTPPATE